MVDVLLQLDWSYTVALRSPLILCKNKVQRECCELIKF